MDLASYAELAVRLVNDRRHPELSAVFDAAAHGDEPAVVAQLNRLLHRYPMTPEISGHDGESWHLHLAERDDAEVKAAIGLAVLITEFGVRRLGRCQAGPCRRAFLDTSSNRSRRYCSERCATRANVAAYRTRRRTPI